MAPYKKIRYKQKYDKTGMPVGADPKRTFTRAKGIGGSSQPKHASSPGGIKPSNGGGSSSRQAGNVRRATPSKTKGGSTQKVRDLSGVSSRGKQALAAMKSARTDDQKKKVLKDYKTQSRGGKK